MKKFCMLGVTLMLGLTVVTGCKWWNTGDLPSVEKVTSYGRTIGYATGVTVKLTKADTNVVNGACLVIKEVRSYIPDSDEKFIDLWPEKVAVIVSDLVAKEKINADLEQPINDLFQCVCKGLDYAKNKHPIWFDYEELAAGVIDGFIVGFDTVTGYDATPAEVASAELVVNETDVANICKLCSVQYKNLSARRQMK